MASSGVLTGKHFFQGDEACAEGAIAAGCRFFGGYPITPSTEIAERLAHRFPFALYRPGEGLDCNGNSTVPDDPSGPTATPADPTPADPTPEDATPEELTPSPTSTSVIPVPSVPIDPVIPTGGPAPTFPVIVPTVP